MHFLTILYILNHRWDLKPILDVTFLLGSYSSYHQVLCIKDNIHFNFRATLDSFKLATKLLNLPGSGLGGDTSDTEVAGEKEKGTTSGDATSSPDCSESDILIPTASRDSRY